MNMRKQTWRAAVSAAAIAASAAIPMAANAATHELYATNTVGGVTVTPASDVKWFFAIDGDKAYLGANDGSVPNGSWEANTALGLDSPTKVTIPRSVTVDGVTYQITEISNRAFYQDTTIESVVALDNINTVGWRSFHGTPVQNVLFKGPNTAADGSQPMASLYANVSGTWRVFEQAKSLKLVIIGPGLKSGYAADRMRMPNAQNASILVPDFQISGNWNALNDSTVGGTNNRVVRYGPNSDFDMAMGDTTMTFYPKNVNGLTNVLSWASTIKSAFDMDTKIVITNRIEVSDGVNIIDSMLQNVMMEAPLRFLAFTPTTANALMDVLAWAPSFMTRFGLDTRISVTNTLDLTGVTIDPTAVSGVTFDRLVFSAKTQTQLDAILGAFPATTPISIDPTGLTENMTIPDDYPNVFVKTVPGVTVKRTASGFMLIVK